LSEAALTPEQALAVEATESDVLVEAGAGTGKTGVMVERYCRLVCDRDVSPDAVLAFTFTDKAATELRQRIRAALELRAAAGSERATELLGSIGGACVTTIHGFCNRILAGHPVAAGIDPRFRVLDAAESERAAHEAFDEALEEFLAGGEEARERTVAAFDIGGLRAMVTGIHAELRSRGTADPRLPDPPPGDPAAAVLRAVSAATEALGELKPTNSSRELIERALEKLGAGEGAPVLDQLTALRTESKAKPMAAYREAIDAAIARTAEAGEGGEAYGHLADLLALFGRRFEAVKGRRAGIDFEDLQLLAARLLEREEIGSAYRERFSHLLVDEFQDTNRLQLRLIEQLRGPSTELMVVGDELQSIYGFRHADLEVFREQRREIGQSGRGTLMALSGNFRSRPEVVGAVNEIGAKLLGESFRPLLVGAPPAEPSPPGDGPAVELLLTARENWDAEGIDLAPATDADTPLNHLAEARFLAARLRELANGGVERGEMAVLLRAFTHLDAYEDSLGRAGLRPRTIGGRGYWSQQQVADVCALLATIANPLDDEALFGALASPACGVAPDTLWLLRAAAGRRRHVWPAVELAAGRGDADLEDPVQLESIPEPELALLRDFTGRIAGLREGWTRLPLGDLIDAAVGATGYDLAILMKPAGEARFANVRKLMRLAAEFESREGRDLRGLLDFLATRAEADTDAQAASAVEGHDGVRIMTVHSAKGLEFGVVAVPQLSRRLLAGSRLPLLTVGREAENPPIGMQLRRLGAASINLYRQEELCKEMQERDAAEELRLFHVAATRARDRLILSGVVMPKPSRETKPGTPVIERIVSGFDLDREQNGSIPIPAPLPREGLDAAFEPSEIAVRVNLPSARQAEWLTARHRDPGADAPLGAGPAPLVERRPPTVASRPLSYTALADYEECAYRFYMERVLDLGASTGGSTSPAGSGPADGGGEEPPGRREAAAARGAAVHTLLEWSQANEWQEPSPALIHEHAIAAGLGSDPDDPHDGLLAPIRAWLGSALLRERVLATGARARAEVPLLLGVSGTVLRGSIDLLVERDGEPPLVVDYKTDSLGGSAPAERVGEYETQRAIYALAVAEARAAAEVEVAYVFLERPSEPVIASLDSAEMDRGRARIAETIARISAGEFPVAPLEDRSWDLCRGCPALGRLCSGPRGA
jgi:ATP-dependent helicase/nuclease subunit A